MNKSSLLILFSLIAATMACRSASLSPGAMEHFSSVVKSCTTANIVAFEPAPKEDDVRPDIVAEYFTITGSVETRRIIELWDSIKHSADLTPNERASMGFGSTTNTLLVFKENSLAGISMRCLQVNPEKWALEVTMAIKFKQSGAFVVYRISEELEIYLTENGAESEVIKWKSVFKDGSCARFLSIDKSTLEIFRKLSG